MDAEADKGTGSANVVPAGKERPPKTRSGREAKGTEIVYRVEQARLLIAQCRYHY